MDMLQLLEEMFVIGSPDVTMINDVIHGLCKVGHDAAKLVDRMLLRGCVPSALRYGVLLQGLCKIGRAAEARTMLSRAPNLNVDQFDTATEQGKRSLKTFFTWHHFTVITAMLISMTILVYIQGSINWSLGFGIPTCLMLLSVTFFFIDRRSYVNVPPEGSVFSSIAQVFVASYRKRKLQLPPLNGVEQQGSLFHDPPFSDGRTVKLPLSQQFRFLNKAAIRCEGESSADDSLANTWRLCSIQQIGEVTCSLLIMPIWVSGVICFLVISQQWSFVVLQSLKMDRHLGPNFQIPAASMASVDKFALIMFIPVYDQFLVPAMRCITKIDGGITLLQRQGIEMVIALIMFIPIYDRFLSLQ